MRGLAAHRGDGVEGREDGAPQDGLGGHQGAALAGRGGTGVLRESDMHGCASERSEEHQR